MPAPTSGSLALRGSTFAVPAPRFADDYSASRQTGQSPGNTPRLTTVKQNTRLVICLKRRSWLMVIKVLCSCVNSAQAIRLPDVQMVGWLVKQQDIRLIGQHTGERSAALLPPSSRGERQDPAAGVPAARLDGRQSSVTNGKRCHHKGFQRCKAGKSGSCSNSAMRRPPCICVFCIINHLLTAGKT